MGLIPPKIVSASKNWKMVSVALLAVILALGIFTRVWEFGTVPRGLHQDEASIGFEAFSLYNFLVFTPHP